MYLTVLRKSFEIIKASNEFNTVSVVFDVKTSVPHLHYFYYHQHKHHILH